MSSGGAGFNGKKLATVLYRNSIDAANSSRRRKDLVKSLKEENFDSNYEVAKPDSWNQYSLLPGSVTKEYLSWPMITQICKMKQLNGCLDKRDGAMFDMDRSALERRVRLYLDASVPLEKLAELEPKLNRLVDTENPPHNHDPNKAREAILREEPFSSDRIRRYAVRPFDVQYAYWTGVSTVWDGARLKLWEQYVNGNKFIAMRRAATVHQEGYPAFYTQCLTDADSIKGRASMFPFTIYQQVDGDLPNLRVSSMANLSLHAREYLADMGFSNPDESHDVASIPWFHVLSISYSPMYLNENSFGIKRDWPRFPFPRDRSLLEDSVQLGKRVAALLDTEHTTPELAASIRTIGLIAGNDLRVDAYWGRSGGGTKINYQDGDVRRRDWRKEEKDSLIGVFEKLDISEARGFEILGEAVDVYMNDDTYWSGVPERVIGTVSVRDLYIGGQPVVRKWLSRREFKFIDRKLTKEEAREMTATIRRLTVLILMSDLLDANYKSCINSIYQWPVRASLSK